MYPLYTGNGNELKKKLIREKIYVPTLWGDVFGITEKDSLEWDFADNIVPLPIDQRYDLKDMDRIAEVIKKCLKT